MKHIIITATAATLALSACASNSDKIAASYVSPTAYGGLTCEQMHVEAATLSAKARSLGVAQDAKAGSDAVMTGVTLLLFWPAIFFIEGDGANAAELAEIKGRAEALESAAIARGCMKGGS